MTAPIGEVEARSKPVLSAGAVDALIDIRTTANAAIRSWVTAVKRKRPLGPMPCITSAATSGPMIEPSPFTRRMPAAVST